MSTKIMHLSKRIKTGWWFAVLYFPTLKSFNSDAMPFLIVNKHLLRDLYGAPCHSCKWLVRIAMVDLYGAYCRSMKMGYFVEFTPNNSRAAIHKLSMILY